MWRKLGPLLCPSSSIHQLLCWLLRTVVLITRLLLQVRRQILYCATRFC
jgi:hypothetical protein